MSYKERTIWISLILMLFIWTDYFWSIDNLNQAKTLTVTAINSLLLKVVVLTIVLEIVAQIIIAIINHKEAKIEEDERDKLIDLYASRSAYYILSFGVVTAILYIVFPNLLTRFPITGVLPTEYVILHIIITIALLAEITKFVLQLYYYRRGL